MQSCMVSIGTRPFPNESPKLHCILILLIVIANPISQNRNTKMSAKETTHFAKTGCLTLYILVCL